MLCVFIYLKDKRIQFSFSNSSDKYLSQLEVSNKFKDAPRGEKDQNIDQTFERTNIDKVWKQNKRRETNAYTHTFKLTKVATK